MEKALARLVEATRIAADYNDAAPYGEFIKIECVRDGIRCSITWEVDTRHYMDESITPWRALHQARVNPMISTLDNLVKTRTEFEG